MAGGSDTATLHKAQGAEPQCGNYEDVAGRLLKQYGERPVARGLTHNGGLLEILVNYTTQTWSILVIGPPSPDNTRFTCLVSAGEAWIGLKHKPRGPQI